MAAFLNSSNLLAGVKDIIAKSLGSNNPNNLVQATVEALTKIKG
jgi:small subunit ribosomal protein S5